MPQIGFAREIITPAVGTPLAGYFNPRPSRGVLDELHVRAFVVADGPVTAALAVCDLIFVSPEATEAMRDHLRAAGADWADHAVLTATHTHTGPYMLPRHEKEADSTYIGQAARAAARAILRAWRGRGPGELRVHAAPEANTLAFNRRYWMKDGTVVTNPGKGNPAIVGPESAIDREIVLLAARREGRLAGLVVNLANHNDTIGGDLISADWPGRMERALQERWGEDVPVLTLIGCSGDVNHFDVASDADQPRSAVAVRRGRGYAAGVGDLLVAGDGAPVPDGAFSVRRGTVEVVGRSLPAECIAEARARLARPAEAAAGDLTSEGLARGEGPVLRHFARQLVDFAEQGMGRTRTFEWARWRMGDAFALATLPGEPFSAVGKAIKAASPCRATMVAELAMGACGYVPMPECFGRGGYETRTTVKGGCREDTATHFIAALSAAVAEP